MNQQKLSESISLELGKILPNCIDIEETVLGSILLEPSCYDKINSIINENMFYSDNHKTIYKTIQSLNDKNSAIDILTVTNKLRQKKLLDEVGGPIAIATLTKRIGSTAHVEVHAMIIKQKYLAREIIRICQHNLQYAYDDSEDIAEVLNRLDHDIAELSNYIYNNATDFNKALSLTLDDIKNKIEGKTIPFLKTNDKDIDNCIKLSLKKILLICSQAKMGKTAIVIWLMRKLLDNYGDKIAIKWYTFEEPQEKIIRRFISMDTMLDDDQLQSKGYIITPKDGEAIDKSVKNFTNYDIEFVDESVKISVVRSEFKLFCKKRLGKYCICIIDNLGLLSDEKRSQTETDDYIAENVVAIRAETSGLIIGLHHFKKDQEDEENLKYGYRPSPKDMKGSTRLRDYVNQVLLINRPGKYKNLYAEEELRWKKLKLFENTTGSFSESMFKSEFWELNPKEDKHTENFEDLYIETWKKLKSVIEKDKDKNGKPLKVAFLISKYQEYLNYYNSKQFGRELKYQKELFSIYTFLKKKMWNNTYKTSRSARDEYLYGDVDNPEGLLKDMFIIDCAVNRDGSFEGIVRMKHDIKHCLFEDFNVSENI